MNKYDNKKITKSNKTKDMVMIGMMGAISTVLMLFAFPMPLSPTFVKMDFSELPIILGGYVMGPMAGIFIILIKIGLNLVLNGTTTMGVGELANMIFSISYMLPAVFIYRKLKTRKGAAVSLIIGTIIASIAALIVNMYLIFPVYAKLYGMSLDAIIAMGSATNPYVTDLFSLMIFSMLPFNIFKYGSVSLFTFLVYKKLSSWLKKYEI